MDREVWEVITNLGSPLDLLTCVAANRTLRQAVLKASLARKANSVYTPPECLLIAFGKDPSCTSSSRATLCARAQHAVVNRVAQKVILYDRSPEGRGVVIEWEWDFEQDLGEYEVIERTSSVEHARQVLARVRSILGNKGKQWSFASSEHFARWCFSGSNADVVKEVVMATVSPTEIASSALASVLVLGDGGLCAWAATRALKSFAQQKVDLHVPIGIYNSSSSTIKAELSTRSRVADTLNFAAYIFEVGTTRDEIGRHDICLLRPPVEAGSLSAFTVKIFAVCGELLAEGEARRGDVLCFENGRLEQVPDPCPPQKNVEASKHEHFSEGSQKCKDHAAVANHPSPPACDC